AVALDRAGDLFLAERGNHCVRRVDARTGRISTVAGNGPTGRSGDGGPASRAALEDPVGLAIDGDGNVFIADLGARRVRRVAARTGVLSTPPGLDGLEPSALAVASDGALLIADAARAVVLRRDRSGALTTIAGNGSLGLPGDGGLASAACFASVDS